MQFIYLTSKKYPSGTADHFFVREMANAFGRVLKKDFLFVVGNNATDFFKSVNVLNLGLKKGRGRTLYYFFWLPYFIFRQGLAAKPVVFFSNDPNLLVDLILIRTLFRFKYRICSEWHTVYGDWRDGFIVRHSDFWVATSYMLRDAIVKKAGRAVDARNALVVYGGVNTQEYGRSSVSELRERLHLPKDKVLVAYVGLFKTLGVKKSIDAMINALAYLPENVMMVFVGGKKDEIAEYRGQISDPALLDRCIFIEKQPHEMVPLYQAAVDILVIPNPDKPPFNNYCIPMKIYEYLASGKPIVYSKLALLDEALSDCGFGFAPDDSRDLAARVSSIMRGESEEVTRKKAIASEKASRYSWDERAKAIVHFLGLRDNQ
ncbi:MAG: glycosyltransferase [Patescibacteria group bacterium]|nr:glycosyltransferase [Patescibacteria group bacterium]